MWVFTRYGLMMPAEFPEAALAGGYAEENHGLQVRGRCRQELRKIRDRYFDVRWCSDVEDTPGLDYEARFYCTRAGLRQAMSRIVDDIDGLKFKPTVADDRYRGMLERIWSVVFSHYSERTQCQICSNRLTRASIDYGETVCQDCEAKEQRCLDELLDSDVPY